MGCTIEHEAPGHKQRFYQRKNMKSAQQYEISMAEDDPHADVLCITD